MVAKNSYSEVKAVVFHAMERLHMTELMDHSVFLFILHLCRHKLFVNYKCDSFRRESIHGMVEGVLDNSDTDNCDVLRELYKEFESDILFLNNRSSDAFCDVVYPLMEVSSNLYDEFYSTLFEDVLLKITSGHKNFDLQPREVSQFISKLSCYNNDGIVYNPFAGYASYGIELKANSGYFGQELNQRVWAIGTLRLLANQINTYNYVCEDSIINWKAKYHKNDNDKYLYDYILATAPFGMQVPHEEFSIEPFKRKCSVEDFFIARGLEGLTPKGKLIGLFSAGVLSRKGSIKDVRMNAVNNNYLEMVVSLPANILAPLTSIQTVILVFNKNKDLNGTVKFIDGTSFFKKEGRRNVLQSEALWAEIQRADSELVKYTSNSDIAKNDYDLTVGRYFLDEINVPSGFRIAKLGDFIDVYKGEQAGEVTGKVIMPSDLSTDSYNFYKSFDDFSTDEVNSTYQVLDRDVLLVSSRRSLRPTYYSSSSNKNLIYCNANIFAFEVKKDLIEESYLVNELNKEYVKKQFEAFLTGSVVPSISLKDLLEIKILVPDLREQQHLIVESAKQTYQSALIREMGLEGVIDKQKQDFIDELRIKKHNLNQYLGHFKNSVSAMSKYFKQKGIDSDFISEQRGITLGNHIDGLLTSVTEMSELVEYLTKEFSFGESQSVDLNKLLSTYENNPIYSRCKIEYVPDRVTINCELEEGQGIETPNASISENDLREVINHIITNAIIHGFSDPGKLDCKIQLRLSFESERSMYVIQICNNGKLFPKGMDTHRYGIKGEKAGATGNDGIGGYRVKSICEHFGGSYEVISEPDSMFPVSVIVKLKKAIGNENI